MVLSARLFRKAYGQDASGEVTPESPGLNINDTAEPQDEMALMPGNPVNEMSDTAAIKEFPFLKPKSNTFPSRSR